MRTELHLSGRWALDSALHWVLYLALYCALYSAAHWAAQWRLQAAWESVREALAFESPILEPELKCPETKVFPLRWRSFPSDAS